MIREFQIEQEDSIPDIARDIPLQVSVKAQK
jgi:hypothetical protein